MFILFYFSFSLLTVAILGFSVYGFLTVLVLKQQVVDFQAYLVRFREQLSDQDKIIKNCLEEIQILDCLIHDQAKNTTNDKSDREVSYKQALKMIEMGGSLKDIMDTCGLIRSEAELLLNLHASPSKSS